MKNTIKVKNRQQERKNKQRKCSWTGLCGEGPLARRGREVALG